MRTIKFRGYDFNHGAWHYGSFIDNNQSDFDCYIQDDNGSLHCVDRDTVGQFTGLKDINGKEIYEGDVIEGVAFDGFKFSNGVVNYIDCGHKVDFKEESAQGFYWLHHIRMDTIRIVGNF